MYIPYSWHVRINLAMAMRNKLNWGNYERCFPLKTITCIHEVDSEGSCWFAQNLLSSTMQEGTKEDRKGGGILYICNYNQAVGWICSSSSDVFLPFSSPFLDPWLPPFPCPVQAMHGSNQHKWRCRRSPGPIIKAALVWCCSPFQAKFSFESDNLMISFNPWHKGIVEAGWTKLELQIFN